MKSNLSVSTTSLCQDVGLISGLQFEEPPRELRSSGEGELSGSELNEPLPPAKQVEAAPVVLPARSAIDNSFSHSTAGGLGNASIEAGQGDKVGLESEKLEVGNSIAGSSGEGEVTTVGAVEPLAFENPPQPRSFVGDNLYYLLGALVLVGWALSKMFARGPNFSSASYVPPERDSSIVGDNPRGQFKKAERFMRPKDKVSKSEEPPGNVSPHTVGEEKTEVTISRR